MERELARGTTLSHYRIVSRIGSGGMGTVYLADDTRLDRRVALKLLLDDVADDAERVRRFIQEAKAASALNHPNILTVFEIGNSDGHHYMATEYVEGRTLRQHAVAGGLDLQSSLAIARQVAAALDAAHKAGILHRDIKPDNIMVRDDGLVKVLDFGLAKLTEPAAPGQPNAPNEDATRARVNTLPGMIMGTVAYMSPEQARGRPLDGRSDIFSLGVVMYELFTGRHAFEGDSHADLISAILKDHPPPIRSVAADLPRQLERIVEKALRKDRDHRYQLIKDLEIDLEDLDEELKFEAKQGRSGQSPVIAPMTEAVAARTNFTESLSATRRFTLLHAILFGAVALAAIGLVWFFAPGGAAGGSRSVNFATKEIASWSSAPGELFGGASFSPDGKMIAFSSTRSGAKNIWVTQATSTDAIQVTNDSFANKDPIWSPKGDEIAYFSQKGNVSDGRTNSTGIWRVSALGGGTPRSVGPVGDGSFELRRWTASGKIYYQLNGDLFAMDLASGSAVRVTAFDRAEGRLVWANVSSDEKRLAFLVQKDNTARLIEGPLDLSTRRQVAEIQGEVSSVAWNSDKDCFFFSAVVSGVSQVHRVLGSEAPDQVTSGGADAFVLDIGPTADSVIVSSAKEESSIWRVSAAGGAEVPVARSINSDLWPSAAPDGSRIVYQTAKNLSRGANLFESAIFIRTVASRDDSGMPLVERGVLPTWAPNGSAVAYLTKSGDSFELRAANPNGGGDRLLASGGIPAIGYSVSPYNQIQTRAFAWSPDSLRIAYPASPAGISNIYTVDAAAGTSTQLTANNAPERVLYCPTFSPDGTKLAYFAQTRSPAADGKTLRTVEVMDLASREVTEVFSSASQFRLLDWASDTTLLIARSETASSLPPETEITRVSLDRATAPVISLMNAYYYNIFISDDRKSIAYAARNADHDDIWMVKTSGGEPKRLTANNDSGLYLSRLAWLRDGAGILFGKQSRFSLLSLMTDPARKGEL